MNIWRRDILGLGLFAAASTPLAAAAAPAAGTRSATPEQQDAWLDGTGSRHRMVFDATSAAGFSSALNFARNFYTANRDGYGIEAQQIGTVIVVRHAATPFGYNDAIWTKYGDAFSDHPLANGGTLVGELVALGTRFAVCGMATARIAELAARKTGGKTDEVLTEIKAGLLPNAVMVPAGIVAVNRAQEHGYTFSYCG